MFSIFKKIDKIHIGDKVRHYPSLKDRNTYTEGITIPTSFDKTYPERYCIRVNRRIENGQEIPFEKGERMLILPMKNGYMTIRGITRHVELIKE